MAEKIQINPLLDNEIATRVFQQFMDIFISPEIERRKKTGELQESFELNIAQAILFPDGRRVIRLNNDVKAIADVGYKDGILKNKGDPVIRQEISKIKKVGLTDYDDPNCAHLFLMRIENAWSIYFDFRYNKKLAKQHIERASEFLDCAKFSYQNEYYGALCDNLFSAMELLVKAVLLMPYPTISEGKSHGQIRNRFNKFVHVGNLKIEYSKTLNKLYEYRLDGRYLRKDITITKEEIENNLNLANKLKNDVERMIS